MVLITLAESSRDDSSDYSPVNRRVNSSPFLHDHDFLDLAVLRQLIEVLGRPEVIESAVVKEPTLLTERAGRAVLWGNDPLGH
jgi:hypothetical protein